MTGTAMSGSVSEGDKLFLLPGNREVRVRAIHSQNEKSATGQVGQRCALQLAGIEKSQIKRGDWLHASAHTQVSNRLNVRLEMSGRLSFKVKHLCPVKLYIGAKLHPPSCICWSDKRMAMSWEQAAACWRSLLLIAQLVAVEAIDLSCAIAVNRPHWGVA